MRTGTSIPGARSPRCLRITTPDFTSWDLADHYGPAEDFIGEFRREFVMRHGAERLSEIQAFTKWVPRPGRVTRRMVDDAIGRSLSRMGVECLDLLQFHWWDYADRSYLDALKHLADVQHEGKIRHLALTNFDTERLRIITDAGIRIVSNQVQYSLIDRRPEAAMAAILPRSRHHACSPMAPCSADCCRKNTSVVPRHIAVSSILRRCRSTTI